MIIIDPTAICCQNGLTPNKFRPLRMVTINKTPAVVPITVPDPPVKAAPPMTTAAMASRRSSAPSVGLAAFNLALTITPASPADAPLIVRAMNFVQAVEMPTRFAAFSLPPKPCWTLTRTQPRKR